MQLVELELHDVRSYATARVAFAPGVTVLVGPNAQGKTNLLEAVHRVGTGSSHRVSGDGPLVRMGADLGVVRVALRTDEGRRRTVELELGTGQRTRTRVDGQDVRRAADAVGVLRVVLFAPEDLAIVRGEPGERRRFLDDLLALRRPAYATARAEYDRSLRQRNALLRQARGLRGSAAEAATATLEVWDDALVRHGATVWAARLAGVHALSGPVDRWYREVADRPEPVTLTYRTAVGVDTLGVPDGGVPDPGPLAVALRARLDEVGADERRRGTTLVGPHRDDLELAIGDLPARGYASHGESWSLALALKLGVHQVVAEVGDRPVVLLDDVFAELDTTRRQRLADACSRFDQVLVTAAVEEDVPLEGARLDVRREDGVSIVTPRDAGAPAPATDGRGADAGTGPRRSTGEVAP